MHPEPYCETLGSGNIPIIMLHGFGINRKSWYDISPMLSDSATIYMVDLIGFGDSPAPEDWHYTIEAQADAVLAFIEKRQMKQVVLVGHSYGGGVALMVCSKLVQNNLSSRVKKLILIGPAAYPQSLPFFIMIPRLPFIGSLILKLAGSRLQMKTGLKAAFHNKAAITDERIDRYAGRLSRGHRNALVQTAKHIIPDEADQLSDKLKDIKIPTLLIYGENEKVISKSNLERLSESLPDCTAKKIKACGHVPHEEYPGLVSEIISEFIKN